jgi:hypothetical protein
MSYQNIRQFVPNNLFPQLGLETFDMSLTSDELGFNQEVVFSPYLIAQTYGNKLPFNFDINNTLSAQDIQLTYKNYNYNNIFISQNYYNPKEEDLTCFSSSTSCDIGFTGIDNGLVTGFTGQTISFTNGLLSDLLKFDRLKFDRRLKLFQVTGYTSSPNVRFSAFNKNVLYEVVSKSDPYIGRYHELYGGFYQGFYKLFGYDYEIFPERMNKGWAIEMLLKPRLVNEYTPNSGETTLNEIYPNNKNIFFYLGTRAENKFYHHADGSPLCFTSYTRVTSGLTKLETCACCNLTITNSRCIYLYPPRSIGGVHDPHINYGCDKCGGNSNLKITCGCSCNELPCQTCGWECQTHDCNVVIQATPTPTPSPTPTPYCNPFPPQTTCTPTCTNCDDCTDCNCGTTGFTSIEDTCEKNPIYDSMSNAFGLRLCGDPKNPSIGVRFLRFTGGCETTGTCVTGLTYETGYTITDICTEPIYPDCEKINPTWLEEEHWFQVNVVWRRYDFYEECDLFYKGGLGDITERVHIESLANNTTSLIAPPYTRNQTPELIDLINLNEKWLKEEKYRKGRLIIYVNGKIIKTIEDFEEIIPRALNTDKEKQVGVPFNISWGGGTQGLRENLTLSSLTSNVLIQDPECFPNNDLSGTTLSGLNTNILIEQNFAGSFDGAISQFRMYITPLSAPEVKHNFLILKNIFRTFNPDCPDCTTVECLPNDLTYDITEHYTTTTTTVILQPLAFLITVSVIPGSIIANYTIRINKILRYDVTLSFTCGFLMKSGNVIYDNQVVTINAGNILVSGQSIINDQYSNFDRKVLFSQPIIHNDVDVSEITFDFGSETEDEIVLLPTPTPTPTVTTTPTTTPTVTPTITSTPTLTPWPTKTATPTNTPTPSITPTITVTPTISLTPTNTPTVTPTNTVTPTITSTPGLTPTSTPTISVSPTSTITPTVTPTNTPTNTPTVTPTITPTTTNTPTITPTSTITPTVTPTVTTTPTVTPTLTPTSSPIVENTIYFGKLSSVNVTANNVSGFSTTEQSTGVNYFVTIPNSPGYGYILIPQYMSQPSMFRDSLSGCNGFVIPIINQDLLEIIDNLGNSSIYRVYRTYVSTSAALNIWLCE